MVKNELSRARSPYLRQHESNPVAWVEWSAEALERARREDKPIFLSVGYSACHWCHVMAHESFENIRVADVLNRHFVCIKLDREERPDLDQIYQNVAQIFTHGGGWPLSVFLTPGLKPFFGGTYFPPEDRYGRPGFLRLVTALADAWLTQRAVVEKNALQLTEAIERMEQPEVAELAPGEGGQLAIEVLDDLARDTMRAFDPEHGGTGGAPKFPSVSTWRALWRHAEWTNSRDEAHAVLETVLAFCRGGLFDPIGGGFHRYCVDEAWTVPHFEKMLYDQGLLLRLLGEVLLGVKAKTVDGVEAEPGAVRLIEFACAETYRYLRREMRGEKGFYFAAQDADTDGVEGLTFVWTPEQLREVLSPEESAWAEQWWGVHEGGNFEHGQSVLSLKGSTEDLAREQGLERESAIRAKLLACRALRPQPGLDDKEIFAWNALLAIGMRACARALLGSDQAEYRSLGAEVEREGERLARTVIERFLARPGSQISGDGLAGPVFLDDVAYAMDCALVWRGELGELADRMIVRGSEILAQEFVDPERGGWSFTSAKGESLLVRPRSIQDQAIPSGVGVALEALSAAQALGITGIAGVDPQTWSTHVSRLTRELSRVSFGASALGGALLAETQGWVTIEGELDPELHSRCEAVGRALKKHSKTAEIQLCFAQTCSRVPAAEVWDQVIRSVRRTP